MNNANTKTPIPYVRVEILINNQLQYMTNVSAQETASFCHQRYRDLSRKGKLEFRISPL